MKKIIIIFTFSVIATGEIVAQNVSSPDTSKKQTPPATLWDKLNFYGDFRFRGEMDWNSWKTDSTLRTDRGRLRYRLRFGFDYKWSDHITFGGRLRSGDSKDQQSPHITFGNEFEVPSINIDKAYLKGNYDKAWWWLGKNSFPFWTQNELWWDDDVTPEGVAIGGKLKAGDKITLKPTAGYFVIYSKGKGLEMDPSLKAGQLTVDVKTEKIEITAASGYFSFKDMPNQNDATGTYALDYSMLNSGVKMNVKTKIPVSVGFDYMLNLEDYSDDTLISKVYRDQTSGYVASLNIGKLKNKKDFLIGYYYAYIPKLSVVDYLAQDDWVRWNYNNATGARSSNFTGHEIRLAYCLGPNFNIVARTFLTKGIVTTGKVLETGNRFRVDFDIKF